MSCNIAFLISLSMLSFSSKIMVSILDLFFSFKIEFDWSTGKTITNISGSLITKKYKAINLDNISYENIELKISDTKNTQILEINKLEELEKMGNFLRNGEFDALFSLVGLINQTDPKQNYLKKFLKYYRMQN